MKFELNYYEKEMLINLLGKEKEKEIFSYIEKEDYVGLYNMVIEPKTQEESTVKRILEATLPKEYLVNKKQSITITDQKRNTSIEKEKNQNNNTKKEVNAQLAQKINSLSIEEQKEFYEKLKKTIIEQDKYLQQQIKMVREKINEKTNNYEIETKLIEHSNETLIKDEKIDIDETLNYNNVIYINDEYNNQELQEELSNEKIDIISQKLIKELKKIKREEKVKQIKNLKIYKSISKIRNKSKIIVKNLKEKQRIIPRHQYSNEEYYEYKEYLTKFYNRKNLSTLKKIQLIQKELNKTIDPSYIKEDERFINKRIKRKKKS